MKKITLFLLLSLCTGFAAMAQRVPTANLTIFSEDGSRFFLVLNGERYNSDPQTNVRIEELPNPYYTCKIVFADAGKKSITRNNLMLADADGVMQDVTYRIKTDRKGKRTLKFYSNIPAAQNMVRPANCATYRYGTPNNMIVSPNGTVYTQQVTQTIANDAFGMNMNVGGIGVNVNVPGSGTTTTTTTTTTTNGGGYAQNYPNNNGGNYPNNGGGYNQGYPNNGAGNYPNNGGYNQGYPNSNGGNYPANGGGYNQGYPNNSGNNPNNGSGANTDYNTTVSGCRAPMGTNDFEDAKNTITSGNFDDTRLSTAKQIITSNCLTAVQVTGLLKLMTFEENKLDLAKFAYGYCVDRKNYFKVVNAFTFDHSKTELNEYIQAQR